MLWLWCIHWWSMDSECNYVLKTICFMIMLNLQHHLWVWSTRLPLKSDTIKVTQTHPISPIVGLNESRTISISVSFPITIDVNILQDGLRMSPELKMWHHLCWRDKRPFKPCRQSPRLHHIELHLKRTKHRWKFQQQPRNNETHYMTLVWWWWCLGLYRTHYSALVFNCMFHRVSTWICSIWRQCWARACVGRIGGRCVQRERCVLARRRETGWEWSGSWWRWRAWLHEYRPTCGWRTPLALGET